MQNLRHLRRPKTTAPEAAGDALGLRRSVARAGEEGRAGFEQIRERLYYRGIGQRDNPGGKTTRRRGRICHEREQRHLNHY